MLLNNCSSGTENHNPYEIVELGKTGIKTTILSMGTDIKGGVHTLEAVKIVVTEPYVDTIHVRLNPYGVNMNAAVEKIELL